MDIKIHKKRTTKMDKLKEFTQMENSKAKALG